METALHVAAASFKRWAEAFAKMQPSAMVPLYSARAVLYGSRPQLYKRHEGVANYFSSLPPQRSRTVEFEDIFAEMLASNVVSAAATANFTVNDGAPIRMRFTHVLVLEEGEWKIANHHASPTPDFPRG